MNGGHREPFGGHERGGTVGLLPAGFDEKVALRREPVFNACCHTAVKVEPVRAAVEGNKRFVNARLRRHGSDGMGGNVRCVDGEDIDPASKTSRERIEQITGVDVASESLEIAPRTLHSYGINIRRVQFCSWESSCKGRTNGSGTAT